MKSTNRFIATSIKPAIQIVTTRVHIDAVARLTVTALTALTPKVARTGSFVLFQLTAPE